MMKKNEAKIENGITIIIPCYNTEKYIEKCLDSILNQNLKKYEVILVDDCSTDKTVSIIKKYEKKYPEFKLIQNHENHGAGYNRNIALSMAQYNLISFVDSDDYLEPNFYKELYEALIKEKADVAVCDIYIKYDSSFENQSDIRVSECDGKATKEKILNQGHAASPCNKLFKKSLLEKFPFPIGIMNEDVATVLAAIVHSNKIAYTSQTYYNYIQRQKSTQNASITFKRFDIFKALDILEQRIRNVKDFKKYFDIIIYQQLIMFYLYIPPKEENFSKRVKFLKELYRKSSKYHIRKNRFLWQFLDVQGRKHRYYYKLYLKLNDNGFSFLASCLLSFYKFYSKNLIKTVIPDNITLTDLINLAKKQASLSKNKKTVSVIVPNYNYANFMYQRIYSILYQKIKIDELIILDDCSTDNSREVIDELVDSLSPFITIKKIYNSTNSGSAFKQWRKGFESAHGDYVWIAEADDFCKNNFLKTVFSTMLRDDSIVISYVDTAFIDKFGKIILPSIKNEIDILKTGHWDHNFIENGQDEIENYAYLNCTIANVSSVLFKKADYSTFFEKSGKYKQAGDWLFYVNVMRTGKIAYNHRALNFYRVHGNNVTSRNKKQAQFDEIVEVHNEIGKESSFTKEQKKNIKDRYAFLKRVWELNKVTSKNS